MVDSFDGLVRLWNQQGDAATTIALAEALDAHAPASLVQEVVELARRKFACNVDVQVAVARMLVTARRLQDSERTLDAIALVSPRNPRVLRWLGEVQLRQGDAEASQRTFELAMELGANDAVTRLWCERAKVFRGIQAKSGPRAVSAHIARASSLWIPARSSIDSARPSATGDSPEEREEVTSLLPFPTETPPPPPSSSSAVSSSWSTSSAASASHEASIPSRRPPPPLPSRRNVLAPGASSSPVVVSAVSLPPSAASLPALPELNDPAPPAPSPSTRAKPSSAASIVSFITSRKPQKHPIDPGAARLRGAWALVLSGAVAAGIAVFVRGQNAQRYAQASELLGHIEDELRSGDPSLFAGASQQLATVETLDAAPGRVALDTARMHALGAVVYGNAHDALLLGQDAARAEARGVKPKELAFARLAIAIEGPASVHATSQVAALDGVGRGDSYYEFFAGLALARAGDPRAADRFGESAQADPAFVPAHIAAATSVLLAGDGKGPSVAREFATKFPSRAEGPVLAAAAWAYSTNRSKLAPADVDSVAAHADDAPRLVASLAHGVAALRAQSKKAFDEAKSQAKRAIETASDPVEATFAGTLAYDLGDDDTAKRGGEVAAGFSPSYAPGRILLAKAASRRGDIDEAVSALEVLDSAQPEVAAVRAAAAYEALDSDRLASSVHALALSGKKNAASNALAMTPFVLRGRAQLSPDKLRTLATSGAIWSEIVAMDAALDGGSLATAEGFVRSSRTWQGANLSAERALRTSRLARYAGKIVSADGLSEAAVRKRPSSARAIAERVEVLVALRRFDEALSVLGALPPARASLGAWLRTYALAAAGRIDAARSQAANAFPPPPDAPVLERAAAAEAFGAMHDLGRGVAFIDDLLQSGVQSPEVVSAAFSLGFSKDEHARGRAIYLRPETVRK